MNENVGDARGAGRIGEGNQMFVMAVDATVRKQSQKMKTMSARLRENILRGLVPSEFALRDCLIDPSQVLIDNSAGSEVEVADLGITHLSLGQADVEATRA